MDKDVEANGGTSKGGCYGCIALIALFLTHLVVGWIYLPSLYYWSIIGLLVLIGILYNYLLPDALPFKESTETTISDPRTADLLRFNTDGPWDLMHKSCVVISFSGQTVKMDSHFLRSMLNQFQSEGFCMHAGNYMRKKRLAEIDDFFNIGERFENGYYINAKMEADSISEVVKGYELWGGWHEWVFGLYNSNSRPRVESNEFREEFTVNEFLSVFSVFDVLVYCNLDMSWGMLIIVNPDRFDEGFEYARTHLGYEAEK